MWFVNQFNIIVFQSSSGSHVVAWAEPEVASMSPPEEPKVDDVIHLYPYERGHPASRIREHAVGSGPKSSQIAGTIQIAEAA